MTRGEAIIEMQRMKKAYCNTHTDGQLKKDSKTIDALEMAIKALEQEPCADCISRQAALDTFGLSEKSRKYGGDHSGYDTIMLYEVQDALEALPPVTPQSKTGWIPCSERLPENGENVLVYVERDAWRDSGVCIRKKCIDIGWQVHGLWHCNGCSNVVGIAWMPLPEPYRAESEE